MPEAVGDAGAEGVADHVVQLGRRGIVEIPFRVRVVLALVDDPPARQARIELAEGTLQLRDGLVDQIVIEIVRVQPLVGVGGEQRTILAQQQFRRDKVEPRQDLLLRVLGFRCLVGDL